MQTNDRSAASDAVVEAAPRLGRFLRATLDRLPDPITPLRYRLMTLLADGPSNNADLATAASVSPPTASTAVEPLVEAGWVSRAVDPDDRRAVVLALTKAGRTELRRADRALAAALTDVLGQMDPADVVALCRGLEALAPHLAR